MPDLLSLNPRTTDLVNLTPHPIRLYHHTAPDTLDNDWDFLVLTVDPTGRTARLAERSAALRHTAMESYTQGDVSIPVESVEYGQVTGLPEEEPGVLLIVPLVTALAVLAAGGRDDLLVPWRQVRNTSGTVIGCRAFAHPFSAVAPIPTPTGVPAEVHEAAPRPLFPYVLDVGSPDSTFYFASGQTTAPLLAERLRKLADRVEQHRPASPPAPAPSGRGVADHPNTKET